MQFLLESKGYSGAIAEPTDGQVKAEKVSPKVDRIARATIGMHVATHLLDIVSEATVGSCWRAAGVWSLHSGASTVDSLAAAVWSLFCLQLVRVWR